MMDVIRKRYIHMERFENKQNKFITKNKQNT